MTGKSDITFNWMITVCDGSLETNSNFPSAKICNGNIKTVSVVAQYLNPDVGSGFYDTLYDCLRYLLGRDPTKDRCMRPSVYYRLISE